MMTLRDVLSSISLVASADGRVMEALVLRRWNSIVFCMMAPSSQLDVKVFLAGGGGHTRERRCTAGILMYPVKLEIELLLVILGVEKRTDKNSGICR